MQSALDQIAHMFDNKLDHASFPWHMLRFQHVTAIRTKLSEQYAPSTVNKMLSALRGVIKDAWRLGQIDTNNYMRATDVKGVRGVQVDAGRCLSSDEVDRLRNSCANSHKGLRDRTIINLMVLYGLRRSEVSGLRISDYDPTTGRIIIHGKGNKERTVYDVCNALSKWLEVRDVNGESMFGLSSQGVYDVLGWIGVRSGIKFTPHDLRRTFVSNALDCGVDINTVARLAGHAQVTTTAQYDKRGEQSKARALKEMYNIS
jgi:site-specific recombinase XerD